METRQYIVADHLFTVEAEESIFQLMGNYVPFQTELAEDSPAPLFSLTVTDGEAIDYVEELNQEEEGQEIICGHTDDGPLERQICRLAGKHTGLYRSHPPAERLSSKIRP